MTSFFTGYLAQGVGGPSGFTENTASGYARQPVTMAPLTGGNTSLATPVSLTAQSTVTVTQRALYDASTGGNLIMWWNLSAGPTVAAGASDNIKVTSLSHTFPDLFGGMGTGSAVVEYLAGRKIGTTADGNAIYAGHFLTVTGGVVAAASAV